MNKATASDPKRLTVRSAALRLDCCLESVRRLVRSGFLRGIYPRGMGRGKPVYLDAHEVNLYAVGCFDELREYQRRFSGD